MSYMLSLTCCCCGISLAPKLSGAVDIEFERREKEAADGCRWPVIGIMCIPCEVKTKKYIEGLS
jgi:hypothetical protein